MQPPEKSINQFVNCDNIQAMGVLRISKQINTVDEEGSRFIVEKLTYKADNGGECFFYQTSNGIHCDLNNDGTAFYAHRLEKVLRIGEMVPNLT